MAIVSATYSDTTHVSVLTYVGGQLTLADLREWLDHPVSADQTGPGEVDCVVTTGTTSITLTPSAVTGY